MKTQKKISDTLLPDPDENQKHSLYVMSQHWLMDLKFFADELQFFRSLIDKYFMWLIEEKNIESVRSIASRLIRLEKRRYTLEQRIIHHSSHLTSYTKNPFPYNWQLFKMEHGEIENALTDFIKDFRMLKQSLFQVTERVIESDGIHHLLSKE